jgi:lipoprotein-releasing system permease protein
MNVEYFIAKRLFTAKEKNNRYTKPILRIAILAISLSVAVMLLSITVLTGFKNEISNKIIGFSSHITITNFTDNQSYESEPIELNQEFYPSITQQQGIKHIQIFATKAGIIKTEDEILGMVLKGVGSDFDPSFFEQNLVVGEVPTYNDTLTSSKVMISKSVADILQLKLGEKLIMYFVEQPPRVRKFIIAGIYETGFGDFDDLIVMADIRHIQKLNGWERNQVGGFEILIDNFDQLEEITAKVYEQIPYNLNAKSIKEQNPQLFDWLDLQDINVRVILILMLIVGGVNMITALLILILERTKLVGILKALGATNWSVRKVFLYNAVYLILKGLFWGNIIGLGIALLQQKFQFISLDPNIYYMITVPINFNFMHILWLNLGTLLICWLILIIPSIIITKITPVKAIRFE